MCISPECQSMFLSILWCGHLILYISPRQRRLLGASWGPPEGLLQGRHQRPLLWTFPNMWGYAFSQYLRIFLLIPHASRQLARLECRLLQPWQPRHTSTRLYWHQKNGAAHQDWQREIQHVHCSGIQAAIVQVSSCPESPLTIFLTDCTTS